MSPTSESTHSDDVVDVHRLVAVDLHLDAAAQNVHEGLPLQVLGEGRRRVRAPRLNVRTERVLRLFDLACLVVSAVREGGQESQHHEGR